MKIKIVLSLDPATPGGGVRTFVFNLSKALQSKGVDIIIVSPAEENNPDFKYIQVGKHPKSNIGYLLRLFMKVPFMDVERDAIIYAQRGDFLFPFLLFKKGGLKGFHVHGQQYRGVKEKGRFRFMIYRGLERYSVRKADFVFFTDKVTEYHYQNMYGDILKNKTTAIIPVGVDTRIFHPMDKKRCREELNIPQDRKVIVSVARFNREKRMDTLIEAYAKAKDTIKDILLILVGDGPEMNNLRNLVKELGIEDSVIFPGMKWPNEIPLYLNASDLFVLSSEREGSPNTIKEAMACGLPIVSTTVGDIKYTITNDKLGFLVPPGNPDKLANAILEALGKEWDSGYITMYAKQFTWENIAKRVMIIYQKVLEGI